MLRRSRLVLPKRVHRIKHAELYGARLTCGNPGKLAARRGRPCDRARVVLGGAARPLEKEWWKQAESLDIWLCFLENQP